MYQGRNEAFIDSDPDEEAAHTFIEGLVIKNVIGFCIIEIVVVAKGVDYGHGDAVKALELVQLDGLIGFRGLRLFGEGVISTGDYETHPAFSPSGDTLYFLKGLPDANFFSICVSYRKNGRWSTPLIASFSGRYLDADPFVTKDGKTLYFVSNRPVKEGDPVKPDWDIWKVPIGGNGWGMPVHLDSPFNSPASEYFPTLADNGNLYFGSGRPGGRGRSDLYVCRWVTDALPRREDMKDFNLRLHSAGNGLGDIYSVDWNEIKL